MSMTFPPIPNIAYADAVATYEAMLTKRDALNGDLVRLRGTRRNGTWPDGSPRWIGGALDQAISDDDADRALATMQGKRDPGQKRAEKIRQEISVIEDQVRIVDRAVVQAEDDVAAALGDQPVIAAAIDALTVQATEDYRQALETLEAARAAFWAAKHSRTWALRFPTERRPFSPGSPPRLARLAHLSANGEPFDPAVVLTELASEVTPPEPVKPHHWEPYRDVETSPSGHVLAISGGSRRVEDDYEPAAAVPTSGLSIDGALVLTDAGDDD